jgi:hypothetical protein
MIAVILFAPNQGARFFWCFSGFSVRSRQVSGGTAQSPQRAVKAAGLAHIHHKLLLFIQLKVIR